MKVLLLNTYATGGGAAVAAQRMLQGLIEAGIDARMLIASTTPNTPSEIETVYGVKQKMAFWGERIQIYIANGFDRTHLFRYSSASFGVDISDHPWVQWSDIIHIHWVQQGFLSLKGLEKLFALPKKRIFWSLHDLWPITGGCHIPYFIEDNTTHFCNQYKNICSVCPILNSKTPHNLAHQTHVRKQAWCYERIHFLGVSDAVTNDLKEYLTRFPSSQTPHTIPNIINSDTFYPAESTESSDKIKLLFIAARVDDPVKGLDILHDVIERAAVQSKLLKEKAELHIIGEMEKPLPHFPIKIVHKRNVSAEELHLEYISAALTLSTSRYETFGQTLLESIASGTPAMAFNVGGTSDIIRPGTNGILIKPYDTAYYAEQLLHFVKNINEVDKIKVAASIARFKAPNIIKSLIELYSA